MELLVVLLILLLIGALGWALRLRQKLDQYEQPFAAPAAALLPEAEPAVQTFPHSAIEAIDVGIVLLDDQRLLRYTNTRANELLGLAETPLEQGLISVLRDYQLDELVRDVLDDAEPREMIVQGPGAQQRSLRIRTTRFTHEGATGLLLIIRDVTQINMLERARRDMVANVSHELRTPLASVKLLVETLQSEPPPAIAQRMLRQMAEEVDAITQLVDELHELSQIEAGRIALQLRAIAIDGIIRHIIERLRPQTERKELRIEAQIEESLPMALIDADRIGQVLLNLLHNASKYTAQGGRIVLGAQLVTVEESQQALDPRRRHYRSPADDPAYEATLPHGHRAGEWLLLWVSDTGVGIPTADLPRIFERFYKVDRARTRDARGTGLGLAIAKHLVEGHGGRIWVNSQEGVGSTFFLTVPVVETV